MKVAKFINHVADKSLDQHAILPLAKKNEILVQYNGILLSDQYILLADPDPNRKVTVLNSTDYSHKEFFTVPDPEGYLKGIDVDPTGEKVLIVWQFDDFPKVEVLSSDGEPLADIDCDELIDLCATDFRWGKDASEVLYLNELSDEEESFRINYDDQTVEW